MEICLSFHLSIIMLSHKMRNKTRSIQEMTTIEGMKRTQLDTGHGVGSDEAKTMGTASNIENQFKSYEIIANGTIETGFTGSQRQDLKSYFSNKLRR